jgi:xanthine dehydrogenase accessory factor
MKMLADRICSLLRAGKPAAVATILSRKGSAPRTAGSKMVIEYGGRFSGTIGGGKFEADVLAAGADALAGGRPQKMFFDLTFEDVSGMDMICGGKMEVLVDYLAPGERESAVFEAWKEALGTKTTGVLVTVMAGNGKEVEKTDHCMVFADATLAGTWPLSNGLLRKLATSAEKGSVSQVIDAEGVQLLVEPVATAKTLLLFGAGHVSMPTARLAAEVGFRVVVIDDRAQFANRQRFASADQIRVPADFASALAGVSIDADSFAVILTRGHRYDKEVLSQILRTEAGYIGMIGSRRKRDAIYGALREEGFSDDDFKRVHCPVGLSIGAETPEEIAVSIVAELIACRAGTGL